MKTEWPLWTTLRTLGNSPAVRLTILIPIVGYLVLLNENVLKYLELSRVIYGTASGPMVATPPISTAHVTWQLLFVYFGLSIVALAATLYALCCPEVIKRFSSSIDYVAHAMGHTGDSYLGKAEEAVRAEPSALQEYNALRKRLDNRNNMSNSPGQTGEAYTTFCRDMLHLYFSMLSKQYSLVRLVTLCCYVIGFVVLGVPAAYTFYRVALLSMNELKVALGI